MSVLKPTHTRSLISHRLSSTSRKLFTTTTATTPNSSPLIIQLDQCKTLPDIKHLHQRLVITGNLINQPTLTTHIIKTYLHFDSPFYALSLLKHLSPSPSYVYWWNQLIKDNVRLGFLDHALSLYRLMLRLDWKPDHFTYPFVFKACGEIPSISAGVSVHGIVCSNGYESNVFVCNALVAMYARCGKLDDAGKVFEDMSQRGVCDVVSWNSIVGAYVQSGNVVKALKMFGRMSYGGLGFRADPVSLVNILPACGSIGASMQGKEVHGYAVRSGLFEDVFVGNAVVDMYAKCGKMREAKKAFDVMEDKDVVSWNAMVTGYSQSGSFDDVMHLFGEMKEKNIELNVVTWSAVIAGYAQRGLGVEALDVFRQMQLSRVAANVVTLVSLLSACAAEGALNPGKETHAHAIKCMLNRQNDYGEDLMVYNALIDMYAKCRSPSNASAIFELIPLKKKNVVSWTVMIGGCAQHGDANEALKLFSQMLHGATHPNAHTISCSLMACSRLAALRSGKQIHAYVIRHHFESVMTFVANCLIDMYAKCGDVDAAQTVFDRMFNKNSVSWTSLMTGYGMHGRGEEALQVFDGMHKAGLLADEITFLVVLYACSHSGMIERGIKYFDTMQREYGVAPKREHYACMVDLLGRAGRLDEAMEMIKGMPVKPSPIVWVALLSACRTHANVELGEYAAERLIELESDYDGSYTLLSNIYANAGRWKDVSRIRLLMKRTGIVKRPGCSWVQGKKETPSFFAGDRSHPLSQQIHEVLADLIKRIKVIGYVPQTSFALHDVDDEEKSDLLYEHSEKLALAYGVLTLAPGTPIRITKNLRFCGDCHSAFTFVSKIVDHEIIVRDSSRFHHFKKGSCSCRGYW